MENYQKYLDPLTLASLEGLDLQARMVVEGYVAGMHPSPYHGFSVEFAEHREYVPGDDIRHVDWKVWSKTDKLYLKQYEQETNLLSYLLLDTSESMAYASDDNVTKLQYAQFIAASLSYLILQQQDSVGLVVYDDAVRRYLKPAGQPSQLKEILHLLDVTPAREKSDLGVVFNDLAERFKKRGVVVDLVRLVRRPARGSSPGSSIFAIAGTRSSCFTFSTRPSSIFRSANTTLFKGLEGMPEILTDPHALKRAYQAELGSFLEELEKGCRMVDIDYVPLRTDQSLGRRAVELSGVAIGPIDDFAEPRMVDAVPETMRRGSMTLPMTAAWLSLGPGIREAPLFFALAAAGVPIVIHLFNGASSAKYPGRQCGFFWRHSQEPPSAAHRAMAACWRSGRWWYCPGRHGDGQAFSRDVWGKSSRQPDSSGHRARRLAHHGLHVGETSRFDQAKGVRPGLSKTHARGDAISVILMGRPRVSSSATLRTTSRSSRRRSTS